MSATRLSPDQCRIVCDTGGFRFASTRGLKPPPSAIDQQRAMEALEMGLKIGGKAYNVFISGPSGTGRSSLARRMTDETAQTLPVPDDVVLLHDFERGNRPRHLMLPAGDGARLQQSAQSWLRAVIAEVPEALDDDATAARKGVIARKYDSQKEAIVAQTSNDARERGFLVQATEQGILTAPLGESGSPMDAEEFEGLPEGRQEELRKLQEEINDRVRQGYREVKKLERAKARELHALEAEVARERIEELLHDRVGAFLENPTLASHFQQASEHLLENLDAILARERNTEDGMTWLAQLRLLRRFEVNLLVDNRHLEHAPVIFETHPTYANLVGRAERETLFGAVVTDFTMIRAGSLLKAAGGFLILNAADLLSHPYAWPALKRALLNQSVSIEDMGEMAGWMGGTEIKPEPIPLQVRVILIGNPFLYFLLQQRIEEFDKIFKIQADFDEWTEYNANSRRSYAAFIGQTCERHGLPHFAPEGVAATIEFAVRLAGVRDKVSLRFGEIVGIVQQAAYLANREGAELVSRAHVEEAVRLKEMRSSRIRERVQESIRSGTIEIDVTGSRVGAINGLAVVGMGSGSFGRPMRISSRVWMGSSGVINIEREVKASDRTHDKGVLILGAWFGQTFGIGRPISMNASITFEQNYAGISGDSASAAELYVILSAIAEAPIAQNIAITGSVNQHGSLQAIGGVNKKIEGFFDIVTQSRKKPKHAGVIIPRSNLRHLNLKREVVEAIEKKTFAIWAIDHIDDGIPLLFDTPAGRQPRSKGFAEGSLYARIDRRLESLAMDLKNYGKPNDAKKSKPQPPAAGENGRDQDKPPKSE